MGDKEVEPESVEKQIVSGTYSLLSFPAATVPARYRNFILSKWLRSLKFGNDFFRLIDSDNYFDYYNAYIQKLLARSGARVRIAVLTDDRDIVLGFSISDRATLHYLYVQKDTRKQGIGAALLPKQIDTITHLTKTGLALWAKLFPRAKFKPFINEE